MTYGENGDRHELCRERIMELEREVAVLRRQLDRAERTRDGVPVFGGDTVYYRDHDGVKPVRVPFPVADLGMGVGVSVSECYSTREAAEAAGGGE